MPHFVRIFTAATLGIPESKIRHRAGRPGGGFGGKLQFTPEEVITVLAARHTGKPCKYTETRSESLVSAHHGRDQWQATLAATADGHVTGLKVEFVRRHGCLPRPGHPGRADPRRVHVQRHLQVPRVPLHLPQCLTNKTWTDAYRGAGRPEATYAIERLMDELAVEVGVDPLEIRERNWIRTRSSRSPRSVGWSTTPGNYEAATAPRQGALRV